ncbi:DUF429 domain-containing protein [Demequina gelatinilytica]|uniref:DUF429 domain-containing protein n=1 Tax=Demequina gelatinilytica TaxID=1638980 RepID=UPI0007832F16|nr:DUF429 domain-containing protein [Demequina gelatinilytica]
MEFVGIDLAWGERARTGLAAVGDAGRLTASGVARSDDEIAAWLAAYAPRAEVIAVDAPLIVPNASGQRRPENLIGRAYGRYGASAHTSNRSKPQFDPPRAARLATRFGWDIDPTAERSTPRCIEVYPHAALVGIFELPQRILYKKGPDRRTGFDQLATLLESVDVLDLAHAPRWAELRATIGSPRPGDLDRIEDEIDAVVCAHVAWLWHHKRASLHVYGSLADGYIVAPPPPSHPADLKRQGVGKARTTVAPLAVAGLSTEATAALTALAASNGVSVGEQARQLIEEGLARRP